MKALVGIILAVIALFFFCLVLRFVMFLLATDSFHTPLSQRQENARKHATSLNLPNPSISCDESKTSCSCSIAYDTNVGRDVKTFQCCVNGCE